MLFLPPIPGGSKIEKRDPDLNLFQEVLRLSPVPGFQTGSEVIWAD